MCYNDVVQNKYDSSKFGHGLCAGAPVICNKFPSILATGNMTNVLYALIKSLFLYINSIT